MPVQLRKVRSVSEVLNATFGFIRENLSVLLRGLIYFAAPPIIISQILSVVAVGQVSPVAGTMGAGGGAGSAYLVMNTLALILQTAGSIVATALLLGGLYAYEQDPDDPLTIDLLRDAVENNWKPVLGVSLMVFLYIVGVSILLGIFMAMGGVLITQSGATGVGVILAGLGALAVLGVFVFVNIRLSLAFPSRIFEPIGANEAVNRSYRLVRGRFWQTAGVMVTAFILGIILTGLFNLPLIVVNVFVMATGFSQATAGVQVLAVAASVLAGLGYTVYTAIPTLAAAFQYYNLVERKDQTGLKESVSEMAEESEESGEASEAASSTDGSAGRPQSEGKTDVSESDEAEPRRSDRDESPRGEPMQDATGQQESASDGREEAPVDADGETESDRDRPQS